MIVRVRHLLLACLTYGALQLALLGATGAAGVETESGSSRAHARSEIPVVALGKRAIESELSARRTPTSPFAPSAPARLALGLATARAAISPPIERKRPRGARLLPSARAPPALS